MTQCSSSSTHRAENERVALVLIVDDSPDCRDLASIILEASGIATLTAASGEEAVRLAAAWDFDLIYMDVQMPGMGGLAATRAIRALDGKRSEAVIVALSASTSMEQIDICLDAGMTTCFQKPYKPSQLVANFNAWKNTTKPC